MDISSEHPSSVYYSQSNKLTDGDALLKACQQHECSGYCMRKSINEHEHRRECRSGAGIEVTKGQCDTPGFPEIDTFTIATERKAKKLKMPRNHNRITQSSLDLLRSWRGNCDIQILVYDSSPSNFDVKEISRVTDYVVGYTCKGGTTLREERQTNKHLAMQMETTTNDSKELTLFVKQLMNKAASRRLITKQECCVLLSNLPLTSCSEHVSTISISNCTRLRSQGSNNDEEENMTFIKKYQRRPTQYEHKSLDEYFHIDQQKRRLPYGIPHFVGLSGPPTYPVTPAYARHTIIVYKAWRIYPTDKDYPTPKDWLDAFDRLINHHKCPKAARMEYDRVMQRYYDGTRYVDPVSCPTGRTQEMEEEDEAAILLAGLSGAKFKNYEDALFTGIHRGKNFNWDTDPEVR